MSNLSIFLQDVAQKCRFWSRSTCDLTTAGNLRTAADELENKARACVDTECPDKEKLRSTAGQGWRKDEAVN